ncbi:hypothetical protein C5C64_13600 [Rathayibacter sp. AY1D3]|nr:hypothetical protein C5C64_13600 [Rathayibacter sp. AY1D3]
MTAAPFWYVPAAGSVEVGVGVDVEVGVGVSVGVGVGVLVGDAVAVGVGVDVETVPAVTTKASRISVDPVDAGLRVAPRRIVTVWVPAGIGPLVHTV